MSTIVQKQPPAPTRKVIDNLDRHLRICSPGHLLIKIPPLVFPALALVLGLSLDGTRRPENFPQVGTRLLNLRSSGQTPSWVLGAGRRNNGDPRQQIARVDSHLVQVVREQGLRLLRVSCDRDHAKVEPWRPF